MTIASADKAYKPLFQGQKETEPTGESASQRTNPF